MKAENPPQIIEGPMVALHVRWTAEEIERASQKALVLASLAASIEYPSRKNGAGA